MGEKIRYYSYLNLIYLQIKLFQNRYLLSFLSALVDLGVFREIILYFLLVGHTGNQVDQLFSILTQEFKKIELKTLEDLEESIRKSINPTPDVERLNFVWDWKGFISGKFSDRELSNHSFYNAFQIVKEGEVTKLRAKRLPQDNVWLPPTGIELIKQNIVYDPVLCADFRIESLNLAKVACDLIKYFKTMPTPVRTLVSDSWCRLRETLEGLPKRQKNIPSMKITDLPKSSLTTTIDLPDEYDFVLSDRSDLPEISGQVCEVGLFDAAVRVDIDVVVYTREVKGRPWVGRVTKVNTNKTFELQWFDRKGKGSTFRAMKTSDNEPYITKLDNSVVMFWDISDQRMSDSFHLSPYWLSKIQKEYEKYDK